MSGFEQVLARYEWDQQQQRIEACTETQVVRAINRAAQAKKLSLDDFQALISPAAEPYLEHMAKVSQQLTQQRFGKTMLLYVPLYLSNMCSNICTYCGFSMEHKIRRTTLTMEQLAEEAQAIKELGFDHILLVTGESERKVGMAYFEQAIKLLKQYFNHISMEVQPLDTDEYRRLSELGVESILVYQETYHREKYAKYHLKGKKSDFDYRLATPERVGEAGINKVGIGCLLGLEDWRTDAFHVAMQLTYLEKKYWKMRFSLSFPRLRPCEGTAEINSPMTDRQLVQLICAYRLFNPQVELSLSTRESALFRDNMLALGVTTMSAGSKTQPGGYASDDSNLEQFSIDDNRSVAQVAQAITDKGYQVVWKDWQQGLNT
ncbi:2-iminoacetate synthase ThiH [Psychrobium sp. 1_MG-2023]|uniref:2-iminoacetate synthase ThiH n=1 Tax=Psychrobium sp. 1_MG-2023 TaxID=3062624 RepID=UPI000C320FFB|nr:2-iminoacetate synthase ThiH [Psychrobium sp. 1_MG-2023]MDP2560171.1 2-iminoacetate synthase ThiH [Psychrobium sp. 1_MG-2023]PKF56982.1 2-iminoacetate synthase ThiH [Alteromonadales bacterium alter-6D02]